MNYKNGIGLFVYITAIFHSRSVNSLSNLHVVVSKGYLAIPEKYDRLITSLRTATAKEYSLDKEQTSCADLLDALR